MYAKVSEGKKKQNVHPKRIAKKKMKRTMFYNDGGQSTLRRAERASPTTRAERASLFSSGGEVEGRWKQAAEAIGGRTTVDAVLDHGRCAAEIFVANPCFD